MCIFEHFSPYTFSYPSKSIKQIGHSLKSYCSISFSIIYQSKVFFCKHFFILLNFLKKYSLYFKRNWNTCFYFNSQRLLYFFFFLPNEPLIMINKFIVFHSIPITAAASFSAYHYSTELFIKSYLPNSSLNKLFPNFLIQFHAKYFFALIMLAFFRIKLFHLLLNL